MGRLDDIVPVETSKESFRGEAPESPRESLRDIMEAHARELEIEDEVVSKIAHEPQTTRGRDEHGRFTAKDDEPSEPVAPKPKSQKPNFEARQSDQGGRIEAMQEPAIESKPVSAPLLVPASWAADAKDAWNQTPRRAQEEFIKRENDLRRGLQQATDQAKQVGGEWSEVDKLLTPYREQFARAGVSSGQVIGQMMAWQQYLDNPDTRAQAFQQLAQSYGTSLDQLAQVSAAQPQEPSYVREIRQQNQQLMQMFRQQQQASQQTQHSGVVSDIQAFASETDQSGNALRPHIGYVEEEMAAFLPSLRSANPGWNNRQLLQAAYEKAVWANPSTRELEMRKAQPAPNKQNIERARRAAKMVNGEAIGPEVEDSPKDLRATIRAHAAKLGM